MKRLSLFLIAILGVCLLSSCGRYYGNTAYAPEPLYDMTIAVLPYAVTTTGRITDRISPEEMDDMSLAEGEAFQLSMYHQLIDRLSRSPYNHNIEVQHFNETNSLLDNDSIDFLNIDRYSAKEMAAILGVDAVIFSEVHKQMYLTDMESLGISIAETLAFIFTDWWWYFPSSRTGDVYISSSLIRGDSGTTLWAASRKCATNWNNNTYDIVERINYRITKRMPI